MAPTRGLLAEMELTKPVLIRPVASFWRRDWVKRERTTPAFRMTRSPKNWPDHAA